METIKEGGGYLSHPNDQAGFQMDPLGPHPVFQIVPTLTHG